MNIVEKVIREGILLSAAQFAPIFAKAWYVDIDGDLYEKVDDYEKENGELCQQRSDRELQSAPSGA